ncbi:hypothetical protein [Chondromyces crocatus]|uniref:Uncharacterized protein n=1 Tax=Chondromyces crocatus TaxID=52 RepID=A0A0K1EA03_CHOCO|nr:hypothetical protein [Chondromyces crocatus]AKT37706.1 uncharacterized protein CMC5_018480 [Chondromyces crocatus]
MRVQLRWAVLLIAALSGASCATYSQDLERARSHYEANQYEQALALFRVLEPDMDSFSAAEQAQYAYHRGMTDYRLAELSPQGTGVADPRKAFRDNARHWLALAAAIEKNTPGSVNTDQKQRLTTTLTDLNQDVFGGGEALAEASAPSGNGGPSDAATVPTSPEGGPPGSSPPQAVP